MESVENRSDVGCIQTYTGKRFWPLSPRVEDVDIQDIAHALAYQCRFTGHCRQFYSIAEHCVRVSNLVEFRTNGKVASMFGLLHDASEAYLHDIAAPLKRLPEFAMYRKCEENLQNIIQEAFGLPAGLPLSVKFADKVLLMTEKRDLMLPTSWDHVWANGVEPLPERIEPMSAPQAANAFYARFCSLVDELGWGFPR